MAVRRCPICETPAVSGFCSEAHWLAWIRPRTTGMLRQAVAGVAMTCASRLAEAIVELLNYVAAGAEQGRWAIAERERKRQERQ